MTKILAVLDPREKNHHALKRCKEQSPGNELEIHAVHFIEHSSAQTFAKSFAERTQWLQAQVQPYIDDGYKISAEVIPFNNLYESVIEAANKFQADFVVKPMRQHSLFQTVVRTSTDWNLIRHCPYPLLLVSEQDRIAGKPVLAAVDVSTGDASHETLNDVVLKQAHRFAEVLDGDLHVVNAWREPVPVMAVGGMDPTPLPSGNDIRREHMAGLQGVSWDIPEAHRHIHEGPASVVINEVTSRIDAGVLVIGTVARTGISGALVGNTAEAVLKGTSCDVMVVKLPE
jgi:universal stress protein E